MSFLPPDRGLPRFLLPEASRLHPPAHLLVDLRALCADNRIVWTWPARRWHGAEIVVLLELRCEQWPPTSWSGYVSDRDVAWLRLAFGGRAAELEMSGPDEDLDLLLRRPRDALRVSVWSPIP